MADTSEDTSGKSSETKLVKLDAGNKVTFGQIGELERRYSEFIDLKDEIGFFRGLASYVQYIAETPSLDLAAASIKKIEEVDEKQITTLEKKVRQEIRKSELEIYKIIESNHLDWPYLKEVVKEYEGIKDGSIQSTATKEEALFGGLARIAGSIFEKGHKDLVKEYVQEYHDTGSIAAYKIAPSYDEYVVELNKFRERRKTSVWGSWDKLVLVYLVIHKYDEEISRLDPIKDVWRRMNFMGLRGEMMKVLEGKGGDRIEFKLEEYRTCAKEVNGYLMKYSHGDEFLESIQLLRKNISQVITPSIEFPNRFVKEMQEVADKVKGFSEGYRKMATTIVEPMQILNKRIGEIANMYSNVRLPVTDIPPISEDVPSLSIPENYTNVLLQRLININTEILEEIRLQKRDNYSGFGIVQKKVDAIYVESDLPKAQAAKLYRELRREYKVRGKQAKMLEVLCSKKRGYTLQELEVEVNSKSIKDVKRELVKKISLGGYDIKAKKDGPYESKYRLVFPTSGISPVKND